MATVLVVVGIVLLSLVVLAALSDRRDRRSGAKVRSPGDLGRAGRSERNRSRWVRAQLDRSVMPTDDPDDAAWTADRRRTPSGSGGPPAIRRLRGMVDGELLVGSSAASERASIGVVRTCWRCGYGTPSVSCEACGVWVIDLDPGRVPESLRGLLPVARRWGISDDGYRADTLNGASDSDLWELLTGFEAVPDDLWAWLGAPDTFSPSHPNEYVALTCLTMAYEEAQSVVARRGMPPPTLPC